MAKPALALAIVVLVGGCATEHRTVVVSAADPCASYGLTASSADYSRCQEMLATQRRAGRAAIGYSEAALIADSQAACAAYGLPRNSAPFNRCVQDEFAARRPG